MATGSSPRKWIFASIFAAILGLIDMAILIAQHYRIANEGLMGKSFCTLSSVIDCDTALASSEAYLGNIPNAELGFLFYLVVAFLSIWALSSASRRDSILSYLLLASAAGTLYSIYMAYILFAKLKVICLFCSASHLLTLALLCFLLAATKTKVWNFFGFITQYIKRTIKPPEERSQKTVFFQYFAITIIIYGVGILFFFGLNERAHSGSPKIDRQALIRYFYEQEPFDIELPEGPFWGPKDAPITIVDFSDFQCPFCRRAAFSLKPFLGEFRDDVRILFLNYPLDQSCNPAIKRAGHAVACLAAKAALCVYQTKGEEAFWKYHDLVFENQDRLSHSVLTRELAPQVGMATEVMGKCLISDEVETRLAQEIALGTSIGIDGTPAIYINGRYFRGWLQPTIFREIIKAELKRSKENPTPPELLPAVKP